jgi:hypothetical protein
MNDSNRFEVISSGPYNLKIVAQTMTECMDMIRRNSDMVDFWAVLDHSTKTVVALSQDWKVLPTFKPAVN